MANRYSRVDYRRFASIIRSAAHSLPLDMKAGSPEYGAAELIRHDIANAIAYEFEKDDREKFDRKQFFALAGANDPKESK